MNGQRLRYAVPAAVTGLAWALGLAGCTTGSPAPPTGSTGSTTSVVATTSSSASTSVGSPSASTSGSATRPPYPTDVPADALPNTPQGAEAFVRYFLQMLNQGLVRAEPGVLARVSESDCKSCNAYENMMRSAQSNGRRFDRNAFVVQEVVRVFDTGPGAALTVDAVVRQQVVRILDASGNVVDSWSEKTAVLVFDLTRDGEVWRVKEVQVRA